MTLLKTQPTLEALDNPIPTGAKRVDRWLGQSREERSAALDIPGLRRKYGPERAYAPRMHEGTFQVPTGVTPATYERVRNEKIRKFIESRQKRGFDWLSDRRVQVYPGMYPAVDLHSGLFLLGVREFIVRAWFQARSPKPLRLELPPHLTRPVVAGASDPQGV